MKKYEQLSPFLVINPFANGGEEENVGRVHGKAVEGQEPQVLVVHLEQEQAECKHP